MSLRHDMSSYHDMSTCHDMSESHKRFCLNLDALAVPEAVVNTIRILEMLSTRLNPPPQNPPEKNHHRIYPGTLIIESAMLPGAPGTPPELLGWLKRRFSKMFLNKNAFGLV